MNPLPRFYPVSAEALPKWIPTTFIAAVGYRERDDKPKRDLHFLLSDTHWRMLGRANGRDGWTYVALRWYWYARVELLLQACLYYALDLLVLSGFLVVDEGGFYHEGRWTFCFWQGLEQRAYRRGVADANQVVHSQMDRWKKREFRRGRRHGFFLGQEYYRRFMLRHLRDLKKDVHELRATYYDG